MFLSPRSWRALAIAGMSAVALSACNPVLVPLFSDTAPRGCFNGDVWGPMQYTGPNDAALDILVTSPDDPALATRSMQVALSYPDTPASAANAVRVGSGVHTNYSVLASGQLIDVSVCTADGSDISGFEYSIILVTHDIDNQRVGQLRGTR